MFSAYNVKVDDSNQNARRVMILYISLFFFSMHIPSRVKKQLSVIMVNWGLDFNSTRSIVSQKNVYLSSAARQLLIAARRSCIKLVWIFYAASWRHWAEETVLTICIPYVWLNEVKPFDGGSQACMLPYYCSCSLKFLLGAVTLFSSSFMFQVIHPMVALYEVYRRK